MYLGALVNYFKRREGVKISPNILLFQTLVVLEKKRLTTIIYLGTEKSPDSTTHLRTYIIVQRVHHKQLFS